MVSITVFLAYQTVQPILPLYITQKGASGLELGVIVSLLSFIAIAAKIPLGLLSERIGRWPIIPAVAVGQTLSLLLYSLAPEVAWFYPIRTIHALVLAAFAPAAVSITLDLAPVGKLGDTMGKYLTSVGVAAMLGPFLCTFFVNYVDYGTLFQVASLIPLLGLVPFLLIRRRNSIPPLAREHNNSGFLVFMKQVVRSRNLLVLTYLRLIFSFTSAFFLTLFAVYAESTLFLLPSLIAFLFGMKGVTNMVSRIPVGRLVDRIGHRWPIFAAFTTLTLAFAALSFTQNVYLLAVAMALYGFAHGMRAVSEWSLLGDCAAAETRNIATAYLSTMFNIGAALGGITAGALSMLLETPIIFRLASVIVLTGAIAVALIRFETSFR